MKYGFFLTQMDQEFAVSIVSAFFASALAASSVVGRDDDQPAQRHVAGKKFRRFGRIGADGRVITYTDSSGLHADGYSVDDDRYLNHAIDTQTYGKPLPVSGCLWSQADRG